MKFEFTESQISNLIIFLDRVQVQGFKEITAINEIMAVLNNPVQEESDTDSKK